MKFEELFDFPKQAGIYYFKNTLNGKYYIGLAQEIRERVLKHKTNFESGSYPDAHLYRSWRKYGIEIFEAGVLEIVDLPKGDERNKKLDELEKIYIDLFNSYGTSGYNQTRGGDGGIDGYKFTDLQKRRVSINSKTNSLDGRYHLYFYDTKTGQFGETPSFQIINDILGGNVRFRESQLTYYGRYIFSKTKKKLEKKIREYKVSDYILVRNCLDKKTRDLQYEINKRVAEILKEIDDFFEEYGRAKYNRKDNKAKKEAIRKLQKADLEAGISKKDYMEKYQIKTTKVFYDHIHRLCPDWKSNEDDEVSISLTDEMREDILNGILRVKFIQKYKVSEATYYRFRHKLEDELNIKIVSIKPGKNTEKITEEQEQDILNGITSFEYMKKYNLSESTFYEHRKCVSKKHPEYHYKQNFSNKKVDIELIREDIENGITKRDFCIKYNLSESCYKKYKKIIFNKKDTLPKSVTEEMIEDIKCGMSAHDFEKKYNIGRSAFYRYRDILLKPEEKPNPYNSLEKAISKEQREDILNGISSREYMIKYNCTIRTFYTHRKYIIPNPEERLSKRYDYERNTNRGLTDEQRNDLLNGISERDYMLKYRVSRKTYDKYKKIVLNEECP